MNRIVEFFRNRHNAIYKGILFVIAGLLIVYLLPKEARFRYDLTNIKGKPWHYESLVAPFEFSILKSPAQIAEERRKAMENFRPYWRLDENVKKQSIDSLRKLMTRDWPVRTGDPEVLPAYPLPAGATLNLPPAGRTAHYLAAAALLDSVYTRGVIASGAETEESIQLIRGNVTEETWRPGLLSLREADSLLAARLRSARDIDEGRLIPLVKNLLRPNITRDSAYTELMRRLSLEGISPTRGGKAKDQIVINRGVIVDEEKYEELLSLKAAYESQAGGTKGWLIILGQSVLVTLCLLILFLFLLLFRRDTLNDDTRVLFVLLMMVLMVALSHLPAVFETISLWAMPFCILPIIMRAFFDTRTALFTHLLTILMIALSMPERRYEFVFIQTIAGIIAIFSIVNMRNRSQIFFSVFVISGTYLLSFFGLTAVVDASTDSLDWNDLLSFGISAFLVLLAYPLIYFCEKLFGFVSDVTLLELSDTNHPLLRELATRAPGTFQHSLQVSNLAEEAIHRVGGNALLVRTGALYHDIGKADMPMYFIENQVGDVNPHDELNFEESASMIISHVERGIEKAKAARLPDSVIDFIRTHHGTTNTAYFLTLYKKNNPENIIDEELFRYPGPIPYSKETAVVMMADSVEAASRSLLKYDAEAIDKLVDDIIASQLAQDQFSNANITMRDIAEIKKIFKRKLRSIYHVRVEYPK